MIPQNVVVCGALKRVLIGSGFVTVSFHLSAIFEKRVF
jgi:hypothetical protein